MFAVKARKPGTVPSLLLLSDPTLSGLLDKLYNAETQAASMQNITGEKNDALLLARAEITNIKGDILENIGNIRSNLLMVKNRVNDQISQNNYMLKGIPQKERAFLDISRQQSIKNNIYTFLLQKREETALSSASTSADLRVIETPDILWTNQAHC